MPPAAEYARLRARIDQPMAGLIDVPSTAMGGAILFVLDTSQRARVCDCEGGAESRLLSQCKAARLMCCGRVPEKVAVVLVSGSGARVHFGFEQGWADGVRSLVATPPEADWPTEGDPQVNPTRYADALALCYDLIRREAGTLGPREEGASLEVRLAWFFASPVTGIEACEGRLAQLAGELRALGDSVEVQEKFILHPDAYSESYQERLGHGGWAQEAGASEPDLSSRPSSTDQEIQVLRRCFEPAALSWSLSRQDFMATLKAYPRHYLGCSQEQAESRCEAMFSDPEESDGAGSSDSSAGREGEGRPASAA